MLYRRKLVAWRLRRGGEMATERSDGAKRRQRRAYGEEDDAGLGLSGPAVGLRVRKEERGKGREKIGRAHV